MGRLLAMLILLIAGWAPQALAGPVDPPKKLATASADYTPFSVTFDNNGNWSQVYVYSWYYDTEGSAVELFGSWPGQEFTTYEKVNGVDRYLIDCSIALPSGTVPMIIFNNGNGTQTSDLNLVNGAHYNADGLIEEEGVYTTYKLYFQTSSDSEKGCYLSATSVQGTSIDVEGEFEHDPIDPSINLYKFEFQLSQGDALTYLYINDSWNEYEFRYIENGIFTADGFSRLYGEKAPATPVKTPLITPSSRTFYESFVATLGNRDSRDCQIYYTLDGTDPDPATATLYDGNGINVPEGADMTIKAIAVCSDGQSDVSTATYTYKKTYTLSVNANKPAGIELSYWGNMTPSDKDPSKYLVPEGEYVDIAVYARSGYRINNIKLDGATQEDSYYINFVMPANDVSLNIDVVYDPSSPGNPMPTPPVSTYSVTYVYNPVSAGTTRVYEGYEAGERVRLYARLNSNYRFINYVVDGLEVQQDESTSSYYVDIVDRDVVVTVNAAFQPENPDDPTVPALTHPLTAVSVPAGACTFSYSPGTSVVNGATYNVYAQLHEGYQLKGWLLNGVPVEGELSNPFTGVMTEQGAVVTAVCSYNPGGPANPGANSYNELTGMMIIDDFTPGNLYSAVSTLLNGRGFDAVTSLIVKGKVTASDFSLIKNMTVLQSVDLSRTNGAGEVPTYTFEYLPVTSVILPADIAKINNNAFYGCGNLVSLSVHATVPPTLDTYAFNSFTPANCVLRVPEESIELYKAAEGWKDFADIVPLGDAVHVLEVRLPQAYWDGRLKNNRIDLINTATGRRQKYVITERPIYTFNGVMKDEQYLVLMMSETGLEMSRIENVMIPDADYTVVFTTVKEMVPVQAKVVTPENEDVTSGCTVEWFEVTKDNSRVFLRKAAELGKVPEGQNLECRVTMNRDLALKYTNPEAVTITITPDNGVVEIPLAALRNVVVGGRVVDEEGNPLTNATVNIRQQIAGKYDKSAVSKVEKDGTWAGVLLEAPLTVVTYSAPECINRVDTIVPDMTLGNIDLGDVEMRSSVGARIAFSLSFRKAVKPGETSVRDDDYTDRDNLNFKVYNETQKRQHPVNVQNNTLFVLEPNLDPADMLTISLSSNNDDFLPVQTTVAVGENFRPEVSFSLIGKGGVSATYGSTDSPAVSGMLYDAQGKYIKRAVFSGNTLEFNGLDAGDYTLVAMTKSDILNAAATLAALDEIGLKADKDYVSQKFSVSQGVISEVEFGTIPSVDESLYTFTGSATSLTPNRNSVTSGQYLTIRSMVDFKPIYRSRISDVSMEFTIPEGSDFVEQSMMKGSNKFGYNRVGDKVIVDFGSNYAEQLRFCVIPTRPGQVEITGRVTFKLDGQILSQPVGAAAATVKDFEFTAPSRTCYNDIVVSGSATPNSKVVIMQDGVMIGESTSSQGGGWTVNCTLVDTYHQSQHQLQAVVTTPDGITLTSGTRSITFDGNAIMIDRVTMLTGSEEVVFDFSGVGNTQSYTWVDDRLFTFIVKLTENAPEKISDVILYVKQLDGDTKPFSCYYSVSRDAWLCVGNFTSATAPVNVAVSVINAEGLVFDRAHFDETIAGKDALIAEGQALQDELTRLSAEEAAVEAESAKVESTFDELIPGWENYSDEEVRNAIERLMTVTGEEVPNYDYPADQLATEEEIDQMISESLTSLLPVETPDYDKIAAEMAEIAEDADYGDFTFDVTDTDLTVDTDFGELNYQEIAYSDVDFSNYSENQISLLTQNDGSVVKVITTDTEWIIADELKGKAWVIKMTDESTAMMKAPADVFATLQKWLKKAQEVYGNVKTFLDLILSKAEAEFEAIQNEVEVAKRNANELYMGKLNFSKRIRIIEEQLDGMKKNAALSPEYEAKMRRQIKLLEEYRDDCVKQFDKCCKEYNKAAKTLAQKNTKFWVKKAMLDKVTNIIDVSWRWLKFIDWGVNGVQDYNRWSSFISSIMPCPDDSEAAEQLVQDAKDYRETVTYGYIGAVSLAATSAGMSTALLLMSNNPATAVATKVLSILADFISGMVYDKGKEIYDETRNDSRTWINLCIKRRRNLKCHKDEDPNAPWNSPLDDLPGDPEESNRTEAGNDAEKRVVIDPAGYVYEGVHSNRVEGVQATAYYREEVEDMFGDKHLNVVLWNAEEYAQQNPLFTDAQGMYAWDVPPGEWQVKFEKDGYNTTYSEWLPVPPPQLEVNVEITQNSQPEVKEVHAYAEGVDITFDKYMDPETLTTSNIFVTADSNRLSGKVEMLDTESVDLTGLDENARNLVSKVRFVPDQALSMTTGKVRLTINRDVKSYANIPMTETYTQELDVEKEVKEITVGDDLVKVLYGGDKTVTVSVLPSEAGMGRTLRIANSSPLVTTAAEEIVLDELGQGQLRLTGDMPGSAMLTFSVDNSNCTGKVKVNVLEELIEAEKPTANRPSGSTMYRGEKIELKSESKGAVIYFTTDGTDPSDADGARRKYSVPVVLDEDLEVKAVAEVDGEQSEVSDFLFTIKRSAIDFRPAEGWNWISHNFDTAVAPSDIAAENVKAILSQTDEVVADPKLGLVGTLTELDALHSYKVQADGTAAAKRVETYAFNPANPLHLTSGWNWVGYPVDQEMTVGEALANGTFAAEDVIVGQDGSAQFNGEQWIGTLSTLKPGAGYMLRSADDVEFAYNNTAVSSARALNAAGIPYKAPWAADSRKYAKAMVVVAEVVDMNGVAAEDNDWYVGAFNGTECRGVGRWIGGMVMMNVFGETGDDIKLRLINAETEKEVEMKETLPFSETVVGSVINPYCIRVNGTSGVQSADALYNGSVAVVDGQLVAEACDALEVFDSAGVKVISVANYDGSAISLDSCMKGVHVVSVRNGDNYSYAKIMVK